MKSKSSPDVAVFEDKRLTKPIRASSETGFARCGDVVRLVARLDIGSSTFWVPPVVIPALLNAFDRSKMA